MAAWDRLPAETDPAFAAFRAYLLQAGKRSIEVLWQEGAGKVRGKRGQIAPRHWYRWSSEHDWVNRAAAYDQHLFDLELETVERRKREQRELEWQIAKMGLQIVLDALPTARQFMRSERRFYPGENGTPDREVITISFDVTGLSIAGNNFGKQGRLSNEQPTDHLQLSGAALDALLAREYTRIVYGGKAPSLPEDEGDADTGGEYRAALPPVVDADDP